MCYYTQRSSRRRICQESSGLNTKIKNGFDFLNMIIMQRNPSSNDNTLEEEDCLQFCL